MTSDTVGGFPAVTPGAASRTVKQGARRGSQVFGAGFSKEGGEGGTVRSQRVRDRGGRPNWGLKVDWGRGWGL